MLGEIVEEIVKEKATFERISSIIDVAGKELPYLVFFTLLILLGDFSCLRLPSFTALYF